MALKSNLEMAEEIQRAISAIVAGSQAYSIGEGPESKSYTKADLGQLQNMFRYYKSQSESDTNGSRVGITYPTF